ncbi:hypothetical protein F3157_13700 [Virgibacillus dakarensis]|uniref:Uncharacterized protein n=1 Tax=Lentibacillus populi TaxID=1827502 RepID=A0A9W5U2M5_9BACI|nr:MULTISPECIES: hypothetical protein [Bacillaceae]MBT2217661.1 hypothetical protein [Virgibacillus dakarensis]MTW86707.1 hypothetical protein [Virgibacillus dakarensis]GGB60563.1 hypothetical protein GCM10011409_42390 [Lentibacillus populi]
MSKWFYFNLLLLIAAVWQVVKTFSFQGIQLHITIGFAGLLFFLFNWTRHAVYSTIRNTPERKTKIRLANLSKKIVPYHRWIGTTALIAIVIHAIFVINRYGLHLYWLKMTAGLVAGILLIGMVTTGWLRLFKPTVRKRKLHIYIGIILFFVIFAHVLL